MDTNIKRKTPGPRIRYPHPCTGTVSSEGFPEFLGAELGGSRRNLKLLRAELRSVLSAPFVTLVNSGSSANLAAALWVKGRCGDRRRVLMSGFSFPTTIASYTMLGFDVRLIDVEPDGFAIDVSSLLSELDDRTAAVVPTHFLGFPAPMAEITESARNHGALIVQDACETMNLHIGGRSLYEFGDLITHSFYHPHHLSSYGGGAVIAAASGDHDEIQSVAHWGRACRCHYDEEHCSAPDGVDHHFWYEREGINIELSELNACFARWQLRSWIEQEAKRKEHWGIWESALKDKAGIRTWSMVSNISPFVFPVKVSADRFDAVTSELLSRGVEVRTLMGGAMHRHPAFRHLAHGSLAHCEEMSARTFFVGIHQTLDTAGVRRAAEIVLDVVGEMI